MGNQRAMCERRQLQFPPRYQLACKNDTAEYFSKIFYAAKCENIIENQKSQRQKSQVVESSDGLARITLEELAITHFVKNGTLQNACTTRPRVVAVFGEKCSFAHRQVDEQPTKRSKKNDGKSAVAMLKKGNWQEREPVTDECHD